MIKITSEIALDEKEILVNFIHASGPGGQHVNKVASAVQLRFNVKQSSAFPDDVRARLIRLAGKRITEDGFLIIHAKRYRKQDQNRRDALERLVELIRKASIKPKIRKKTRPTRKSKVRLMAGKKHRSRIKKMRGRVFGSDG